MDCAVDLGNWLILCLVVALACAGFRRAWCFKHYLGHGVRFAVILTALCAMPCAWDMSFSFSTGETGKAFLAERAHAQSQPQAPEPPISPKDAERCQQIIARVLRDPNYLTPEVHKEFWQILRSNSVKQAEINMLRELTAGWNLKYQMAFWQDASQSFKSGQPFKSKDRAQLEKFGLEIKALTSDNLKSDNTMIALIAAREKIINNGQSMVVDQTVLDNRLGIVQSMAQRIDRLFTQSPARVQQ